MMKRLSDYIRALIASTALSQWLHGYVHTMRGRRILDIVLLPVVPFALLAAPFRLLSAHLCKNRYRLAVVAIVKNEAPYLPEWIEYHRQVGVDRFFIYDNDSTDGTAEILRPYVESGLVRYQSLHGKLRQYDAYNMTLRRYGKYCRYLAFIDLDEFLFTPEGSLTAHLDSLFAKSRRIGGVAVNWAIFGSAHRTQKPDGTVIESYLYRSDEHFEKNRHIKTVCRPGLTLALLNPHSAVYRLTHYAVNVIGEKTPGPLSDGVLLTPVRINHYFTKSYEEFTQKRSRGKADNLTPRDDAEFELHDVNDIYDDSMLAYVPTVTAARDDNAGDKAR